MFLNSYLFYLEVDKQRTNSSLACRFIYTKERLKNYFEQCKL